MDEQTEICPSVAPMTEPLEESQIGEMVLLESEFEEFSDVEIDPESVIEAAEMLLRAGAPHDFDVIVIGSGPGGFSCAIHLAQNGQKVALVEQEELGGVCLNQGCIPTKTLLESIQTLHLLRQSHLFGIELQGSIHPDLRYMQARKRETVSRLKSQAHQLAQESGVTLLKGTAALEGDRTIQIATLTGDIQRLSAIHLVLATGGIPLQLPIEGANLPGVLFSHQVLELEEVPRRLVVFGGGAIGVELATFFVELGTHVVLIEQKSTILPEEDDDVQQEMQRLLEDIGIEVLNGTSIQQITEHDNSLHVHCDVAGTHRLLEADLALVAIGRRPNIDSLNLERAGIEVRDDIITVDEDCSTNVTGVWAIGDCIRHIGWAHQAAAEGRRVADAILGFQSPPQTQYIPTCYYTIPEIASVGLTLKAAESLGVLAHTGKYTFAQNERATITGFTTGFVKLVVETETGKLLGAQIIGPRATELINELALALREGLSVAQLAETLHTHPTFAEVILGAARDALRHTP